MLRFKPSLQAAAAFFLAARVYSAGDWVRICGEIMWGDGNLQALVLFQPAWGKPLAKRMYFLKGVVCNCSDPSHRDMAA